MGHGGPHPLIWRKAAVLGSLWAASEIVLGSFLHNAQVPFKGEFLTAIGIVILVSGHRLWPERGLLWRTGLVCAAMKSVSPSAAIFGPMAAISAEGFLAEAGVRLAGANAAGYLLAGGLAMSWAVTHKLGNLLLFYGPDMAAVYLRGVEWLQARFHFAAGSVWGPLAALYGVYFAAGSAAAFAGLRAGDAEARALPAQAPVQAGRPAAGAGGTPRYYSPWALALHLAVIAAVLSSGRGGAARLMPAAAAIYGAACALVYPRALALLKKAGLWAGVLAASVLAGLIVGKTGAGFYMALRAFLLTMGFAAVGSELLNPAIRRFMERRGAGVFFGALEYAFASLPAILAGLPDGREFARRPLAVIGGGVARAPFLLDALERAPVRVITGAQGSGKSTLVCELAQRLRAAGRKPGGICAAGLLSDGRRSGFDLVDLATGRRLPLSRRGLDGAAVTAGPFGFFREGLEAGAAALSPAGLAGADIVFLDEVGPLELEGGGWAPDLERLLAGSRAPLVLVIREGLLPEACRRWGLTPAAVWRAGETGAERALGELSARAPGVLSA